MKQFLGVSVYEMDTRNVSAMKPLKAKSLIELEGTLEERGRFGGCIFRAESPKRQDLVSLLPAVRADAGLLSTEASRCRISRRSGDMLAWFTDHKHVDPADMDGMLGAGYEWQLPTRCGLSLALPGKSLKGHLRPSAAWSATGCRAPNPDLPRPRSGTGSCFSHSV